ncbi:lysophosphatidylserine lipase ABHD12-like isoform X3 [Narcine bancroftii]|uniref:lysophosphatidylserine lipase ABHD12-like isoform X3 n=1 Tax=Narcine bancroftii TaxID=1343680 RepID=UPI0038315E68
MSALGRAAGRLLHNHGFELKRIFLTFIIIYVSIPFIFKMCPNVVRNVVFVNFLHHSFNDFKQPSLYLLNHTINLYLTSEEGITIGVWHTIPDKRWQEASGKEQKWYEAALGDDNPVIVYLHGNGGNRAEEHRVEMVKMLWPELITFPVKPKSSQEVEETRLAFLEGEMLSANGFHILALDYRGWGDSTGEPSEAGITIDSLYLYEWSRARSRRSHVYLWGHSLGSGVAANTARMLHEKVGSPADGIILESPFTTIREEVAHHPFSKYYKYLPGFEWFFLDTMTENNIIFHNVENLKSISTPVLILHAEDDDIIPFELGRKLYESLLDPHVSERIVKFVAFPAFLGYKHNNIYKDPQLPNILKEAVDWLRATENKETTSCLRKRAEEMTHRMVTTITDQSSEAEKTHRLWALATQESLLRPFPDMELRWMMAQLEFCGKKITNQFCTYCGCFLHSCNYLHYLLT